MGQDIHAVIEYRSPLAGCWAALADGEFDLAANRAVIGALVGGGKEPLIRPRDLPTDYSRTVLKLYFNAVTDDSGRVVTKLCPSIGRGQAEEWVAAGTARYYPWVGNPQALINCPEWFSPGWLTRQEVEDALLLHEVPPEELMPQAHAALAAMRVLEAHYGPDEVRLVFWLDS